MSKQEQSYIPTDWHWVVDQSTKRINLLGFGPNGMDTVMAFDRYGMRGAQPMFPVDGILVPASELAVPIPGQEHNASFNKTLKHPIAQLIANAQKLLAENERLKAELDAIKPLARQAVTELRYVTEQLICLQTASLRKRDEYRARSKPFKVANELASVIKLDYPRPDEDGAL